MFKKMSKRLAERNATVASSVKDYSFLFPRLDML